MAALGTAKYGMTTLPAVDAPVAPAASNGATTPAARGRLVDNPVLWLTGIAAVMLGFVGASTAARVGPLSASLSVGKA